MMKFDWLRRRSLVAAAAILLLAAMASPSEDVWALQSTPPTQPAPGAQVKLTGHPWKLISLHGQPLNPKLPRAPQISLVEEGTRIVGYTGCNRFLGTYSLQQDRLSVNNDLAVLRRVCPAEIDVEAPFLKAIQSIDSWKIVDGVLQLSRQNEVLASFK